MADVETERGGGVFFLWRVMHSESEELERLVAASLAGDDGSRNKLMTRLERIVRGFFVNRIGVRDEVDDLVQNTLVRVHQSLDDLREPSSLKSFTMKAALFELHDYYRGRYRAKELVGDVLPEIAAAVADASTSIDVSKALEQLSPRARRIIELREYGFRYAEIASMLESTEAAIKMQVKRAFEKMRDVLTCILLVVSLLLITGS